MWVAVQGRREAMSEELPLEHVSVAPESPDGRPPAVMLLHGRGAQERDLLPVADALPGDMHVVAFRAPTPLGPGFTWYELDLSGGGLHASQPNMDDFAESLAALTESIDLAIDRYDLDPDRIGLLGFSQGAILAMSAMIENPGAYAWIVALHGYLPATYESADIEKGAGTPVFLGAGERDEIIPATRAEQAANRLAAAGVDVTFRTYPVGHGTSPEEVADAREWLSVRADLD